MYYGTLLMYYGTMFQVVRLRANLASSLGMVRSYSTNQTPLEMRAIKETFLEFAENGPRKQ